MRREGTRTRGIRQVAMSGAAIIALAACGGGDAAPGVEVDADAPASASAEDDTTGDDTTGDDTVEDDTVEDDTAADDTPEDEIPEESDGEDDLLIPANVTDENGMATLRPPADAQPDCDDIDDAAPGASLTFPTDDAGILDAGPGPVTIEFVGCSNTFEANLAYDAFHGEDRTPTLTDHTMGGTMGDWSAFSFEETFWTPGRWTVVVYEHDAASGDRQEYDQVTFSID